MQWETEKLQRQIEEFWEFIKTQILDILNPKDRERYQEFLQTFLDLWDQLYQKICVRTR